MLQIPRGEIYRQARTSVWGPIGIQDPEEREFTLKFPILALLEKQVGDVNTEFNIS